jgi:hypothetical protein
VLEQRDDRKAAGDGFVLTKEVNPGRSPDLDPGLAGGMGRERGQSAEGLPSPTMPSRICLRFKETVLRVARSKRLHHDLVR